jgi:hypothetical protein
MLMSSLRLNQYQKNKQRSRKNRTDKNCSCEVNIFSGQVGTFLYVYLCRNALSKARRRTRD